MPRRGGFRQRGRGLRQQDVLELEVAVRDAAAVRVAQRAADLREYGLGLGLGLGLGVMMALKPGAS